MKPNTSFFLRLLLLIAVAGSGFAIGRLTSTPIVEVLPSPEKTKTIALRDAADSLALAKAISEVDALKAENQRLKAEQTVMQTSLSAESEPPPTEEPARRRLSWQERMEELRQTDPERYAAEMERRKQFVDMIEQTRTARVTFLDSIDTSLLPIEAQGVHARFTAALARQGQLQMEMMAYIESGEQPPEALRDQMHETFRELHDMREMERSALLDAIATSMGLTGTDVEDFTILVNEVFTATSNQMIPPGRRPPSPPPQAAPTAL